MCEYCRIADKGLPYAEIRTLANEGEASICEVVALPAINLTTGEEDTHCEPPYWAIRVLWYEDGYDAVVA